MSHILEADSIVLGFKGRKILQDVYIKSETGKVTGLLGRNGSGKTCLMNVIYGNLNPETKFVRLDNKLLLKGHPASSDIQYLPQFSFIPKHLSLKRIFYDFTADFQEFIGVFPEFGKFYTTNCGKLSGGERRIVEIYIILTAKSKFCMLDEPFSQVMPKHVDTIKELIIKEKQNKGIIVTDHLYRHIIDICDSIYLIQNQKVHLIKNLYDIERLGYAKMN